MNTFSTAEDKHRQRNINNDAASFVELLAAIAIGIFGMLLAELGIETNNPISRWLGFLIQFSAAGWITMKFLTAIFDFIDRFKKRDNHNISK